MKELFFIIMLVSVTSLVSMSTETDEWFENALAAKESVLQEISSEADNIMKEILESESIVSNKKMKRLVFVVKKFNKEKKSANSSIKAIYGIENATATELPERIKKVIEIYTSKYLVWKDENDKIRTILSSFEGKDLVVQKSFRTHRFFYIFLILFFGAGVVITGVKNDVEFFGFLGFIIIVISILLLVTGFFS